MTRTLWNCAPVNKLSLKIPKSVVVFAVFGSPAFGVRDAGAAGIALDVQSARGTGLAAADTALVDDSSAIYYNPAGIARGMRVDAQAGDTLIIPSYRFRTPGGATTANSFNAIPPFNVYATAGIRNDFSVGVGVFTPFGSTVNWPDSWVGKSVITSAQFATYDFNPTVAYRWGPVRLGLGLQIVRATVDLKQKIETGTDEASTEVGSGGWGGGANIGVQVDAIPKYLTMGAHYRSAVKFNFDGQAHFDGVPPELQGTLHDQSAKTSLTTPDSFAIGASTRPIDRLALDADVVWFGWSKFHSINIQFPDDASGTLNRSEPKNWSNVVNYHLGAEFAIDRTWTVRAGILYDPTPSHDSTLAPDVPDTDRLNLAAGASYVHPTGFRVDLGYQFLVLFQRTSTYPDLPGTYRGIVDIFALSVGYAAKERPSATTVSEHLR